MKAKRRRPKSKRSKLAVKRGPYKLTSDNLAELLGIVATSSAGVEVTEEKVLSLSAILCGIQRYCKLIAALPLDVFKRTGPRRQVADHLSAHWLLSTEPNPEMTSYVARYAAEWQRLVGGKACYEIEWADNGHPRYLWPLEAWRVKEKRDDEGSLYYLVDGERKVAPADLIYVPLISTDGVVGRGFMDYAADALGLSIAAQDNAGSFFANGGKPGGILHHNGRPGDAERDKFRRVWTDARKKTPNSIGVTWGGWTYEDKGLSVEPDKAQLLDTRRFSTEEAARVLDIPPSLLHDLTKSSWNNLEQQNQHLLVYCLGPVLVSYEQEYNRKLLSPPSVYAKHNVEGLLRAESDKRAAFAKEQFMFGGLTINDWQELNDRDTIGPAGDVRFVPANMVPLERAIAAPAPEPTQVPAPTPTPDIPEKIPTPPLRALLADTLARLARKETNAARRAAKDTRKLDAWMADFYSRHNETLQLALQPILAACAVGPGGAADLAYAWTKRSRAELLALTERVTPAAFAGEAEAIFQTWETERPLQIAEEVLRG
jgi:HK97 family phage portal protein